LGTKKRKLGVQKCLGHFLGVSAAAIAAFRDLYLEEGGAEGFDLFAGRRPNVKRTNLGSQRSGCTNRSQARYSCPNHENARRRGLPSRRHLGTKKAWKVGRGLYHGPISGNIRHG
jgi:hypothetical protein